MQQVDVVAKKELNADSVNKVTFVKTEQSRRIHTI